MSRDESYVLIKKSPIVLSRHLETWNGVVLSSPQGPVIRTFVTVCHRACHCAHGPYIFYSCHQFFSHPSFLIISFVPPTYPLRTGITGVHHTTFLACFVNTCSSNHSVPNEFSFFFFHAQFMQNHLQSHTFHICHLSKMKQIVHFYL